MKNDNKYRRVYAEMFLTNISATLFALRRVILLRSDIRLSAECYLATPSYKRIEYHETDRFNITFAKQKYHADFSQHITIQTKKKEKTRDKRIFSFLLLVGLGFCPNAFVHTNAMLVLIEQYILKQKLR